MQKIIYFIPAIVVISACAGGGSDPLVKKQFNQTPPNTRVLSKDAGTIGEVNTDGVKLTAQKGMVSGVKIDWDADTTTSGASSFAISKGKNGEAVMVVDGVSYAFDSTQRYLEDDGKAHGYDNSQDGLGFDDTKMPYLSLFQYNNNDLDAALADDASNYDRVWQYYVDTVGDSIGKRGFAVVGTQTDFTDVAGNDTASYSGKARFRTANVTEYDGWKSETGYQGKMTMNVNFKQEQVDGSITDIWAKVPNDDDFKAVDGASMTLDPAKINQHGEFAGTVSPNAVVQGLFNLDADDKGAYAGALFGPNAEQIGGTIAVGSSDQNGYGFFTADKQ